MGTIQINQHNLRHGVLVRVHDLSDELAERVARENGNFTAEKVREMLAAGERIHTNLNYFERAARDPLDALREIVTICTESPGACRKRMGTRLGNILVTAEAAIAQAEGRPVRRGRAA